MRQSSHEHAKQMCECAQYCRACLQKLAARSVKRPDHSHKDQDQKKLLPQRPLLPRHGHQPADLIDRPAPDEFDEAEDRRNPVMQEFQELIENLFHNRSLYNQEPWTLDRLVSI